MQNKRFQRKILALCIIALGGTFSLVAGQYYYFDAVTAPNAPYQQGCSENLYIKATTEANVKGALAGLFRVKFDPAHFSYYTGVVPTSIQANLFAANSSMFSSYTNPTLYPYWIDSGTNTILHIDRYNTLSPFIGNGTYGTITNFVPVYSTSEYTGTFAIVYSNDTTKTSLSYAGKNIINSGYQYANLTGYYYVYQKPCADDTTSPAATLVTPSAGTKKSHLSGIQLTLTDTVGDSNVPYVRTGGLPGTGIWTGNSWGINNQYGVNLSTFSIRISGNSSAKIFTGTMFAPAGDLAAVANGTTRQSRERNYTVNIAPSQLFDYGIERPITITGNVRDRNGNNSTFNRTVNTAVGPWLIPGSASPAVGTGGIIATAPITLGIADDRAGVNSGSITVTVQGIGGTVYGPFVFSGSSLNLSGVAGSAMLPDYYINIPNHPDFPTSGTIQVNVYATDMAGTVDTINTYTFGTKPSCSDLGCCDPLYIQTGNNPPFLYSGPILNVSGGLNPSFTMYGTTGILDCGTTNQGMDIYKGTEEFSGVATYLSFFDFPKLLFAGYNDIKAVLSGHTIYLKSTHIFSLIVKAFPSNRVYQDTNNSNTGILKFYDMNKNFVASSLPFTLNDMGTGEVIVSELPPGTYYAIFKGQSHLASYLSGIQVVSGTGNVFDFTTGSNLYGAQNADSETDNGKKYQTAGDLQSSDGKYDYEINGNDISMILYGTFPQVGVDVLDPRNLNGDTAINASDISVIGVNSTKKDPFLVDGGMFIRQ